MLRFDVVSGQGRTATFEEGAHLRTIVISLGAQVRLMPDVGLGIDDHLGGGPGRLQGWERHLDYVGSQSSQEVHGSGRPRISPTLLRSSLYNSSRNFLSSNPISGLTIFFIRIFFPILLKVVGR